MKDNKNWKEKYKKFVEEKYKEKFQGEGNLSSTNRLNWGCEECGGEDAEEDIENFIEQFISERDKECVEVFSLVKKAYWETHTALEKLEQTNIK